MMKILGAILLAGVMFAVVAMEISGHGLVTARPSAVPPKVTPGPNGTTITVVTGLAKVFHVNRIVPVAGVVVLGLVCLFLPGRNETEA